MILLTTLLGLQALGAVLAVRLVRFAAPASLPPPARLPRECRSGEWDFSE
jgi:hypothetical protein